MKVGKNEKGGTLQKIKNERPGTFLGVIESLRSLLSRGGTIKNLWFEKNGLKPQRFHQRRPALTAFASNTARQPNSRMAPAASGTPGMSIAMIPASATIAMIASASAPSSTKSPTSSRNALASMVMAKMRPSDGV